MPNKAIELIREYYPLHAARIEELAATRQAEEWRQNGPYTGNWLLSETSEEALERAFPFADTEEGFEYWRALASQGYDEGYLAAQRIESGFARYLQARQELRS